MVLYITGTRTGVLESDVDWKYHTLWLRNLESFVEGKY